MKTPTSCFGVSPPNSSTIEGEKKHMNKELWQCCAGPLVNLPAAGTHVVYFPQGHSEQVAASMKKDINAQIPSYPNLPPKLLCLLHSITWLADSETDEVYAQMTLQPVPSFDKEALLRSDISMKTNKPQSEFFCKTLTASDTSTHGGFSVPRRAAEKIFPPLDFTMQPPAQELTARDLHNNVWTFRHIYRGQPKRHLLTTGWSLFVGGKRLIAGDSVLFIRDEKQQLLLGIRRANRQPPNLSSSVLSSDSMHIGVLAAAAHAAANNSPFTVFFNPRTSPSEFVIPLAKYYRAVCGTQISLGMRFRMMFETEESGTRRYMGTITGISDLDPVRWKNSQWHNLQVGWDESTAGEKRSRVSIWEIEPVTAPFFLCPTPPFFRPKRPWQPGMPDDESSDVDGLFKRTMPWLGDEFGLKDPQTQSGLSLAQWMNMQQNPSLAKSIQQNCVNPLPGSVLQNFSGNDISRQFGLSATQVPQQNNLQFSVHRPSQSTQQQPNSLGSIVQPQQQQLANVDDQALPTRQGQSQILQSQSPVLAQNILQQQQSVKNHQLQRTTSQNLSQQQQQITGHTQHQNLMPSQLTDEVNQQLHVLDNQIQLQLLQKHNQQPQSVLAQSSGMEQPSLPTQLYDQQKQPLDTPLNITRSIAIGHEFDSSQQISGVHPQSHTGQQMAEDNGQTNIRYGYSSPQSKFQRQQQRPGILSELPERSGSALTPIISQPSAGSGNVFSAGAVGRQPMVTDDIPSCSTSPSTSNCPIAVPSILAGRTLTGSAIVDEIAQPSVCVLNSVGLEPPSNSNFLKERQKPDVHPSITISKGRNQGLFASGSYHNAVGAQGDHLDSSSSATSVLSHNEGQILQNSNAFAFNCRSELSREVSQTGEIRGDLRNNITYGGNIDNHLGMQIIPDSLVTKDMVESGKDFSSTNPLFGSGMVSAYENAKEAQPEFSSSMVSQSFGIPDVAFNSIDSAINDGGFMNRGAWAPPQAPRMRTFTKVYKRGAVGRSIDISRYSGYDELKQDLARRFGIEGQVEDRQRTGWKLVYVDHENDVLLVGDDPWEEFVNCVRCIKILSPQEVQQISLDGDFRKGVIPNQTCSSSENGMN